jgi:ribonuclease P protein subunit POP4
VPKANNVFTFVVSGQVVTLYGNNFTYRASDRSARKFKSKPSVEL